MDNDMAQQMAKEAQIERARHAKAEALADVASALADGDHVAASVAVASWDDTLWNFAATLADVRSPSSTTRHLVSTILNRRARITRVVARRRASVPVHGRRESATLIG